MKSRRPASAHWRSSNTSDGRARVGDPLEERPPGGEQDLPPARRRRLEAEQREQGRLDAASRSSGSGTCAIERRAEPGPGRRLVVALGEAGPAADHLAERPEGDPVAVGRRAAVVPPDPLDDAVDVLLELPGEPALADAGRPGDGHQPRPAIAARRVEELLEQSELLVATDERRLERVARPLAAALGDDPQGAPGRHRLGLALERLLAGRLEGDRRRGRAQRRLADEHGAGRRRRLEAGGRVDEVAGDHPLVRRARGRPPPRRSGRRPGPAMPGAERRGRRRRGRARPGRLARRRPRGRPACPRRPSPRRR